MALYVHEHKLIARYNYNYKTVPDEHFLRLLDTSFNDSIYAKEYLIRNPMAPNVTSTLPGLFKIGVNLSHAGLIRDATRSIHTNTMLWGLLINKYRINLLSSRYANYENFRLTGHYSPTYIERGIDNLFTLKIVTTESHVSAAEFYRDIKEHACYLSAPSAACKETSRTKLAVLKDPDYPFYTMCVTTFNENVFYKVLAWTIKEFLHSKDLLKSFDVDWSTVYYNFFMGNNEEAYEVINNVLAKEFPFDKATALKSMLKQTLDSYFQRYTYAQETKMLELSRTINTKQDDLCRLYTQLQELQAIVIKQTVPENTSELFFNYISKKSEVSDLVISNSNLSFSVDVPLDYFDIDAAPNIQRSVPKELKKLYQKIFIDREYELVTKTHVTWMLDTNSTRYASEYIKDYTRMANPHLLFSNCWGNNLPVITKALSNFDFMTALEYTISSCHNLNLYDGVITSRLFRELLSPSVQKEKRLFRLKNQPDSPLLTYNELAKQTNLKED